MEGGELLSTIGTVAISLAGFSGIVLAIGRQGVGLGQVERYRFSVLMWNTLGATFLSLVPPTLHALGLPATRVWATSSAAMGATVAGLLGVWVVQSLRQMRRSPEIFHLPTFTTLVAMHLANAVLQAVAAGGGPLAGPGVYAIGLVTLVAHGSVQFLRMLFRPAAIRPEERPEQRPA